MRPGPPEYAGMRRGDDSRMGSGAAAAE